MSKGVFRSQNQSKHTHKCSLWDQRGREFLKADHKLIVSDSLLLSKEWANSAMPLSVPDNSQKQARAGSWLQIQETLRARDGLRLENGALETTQKQEAIGLQMEQTVQRKALFSCIK